MSGRFGVFSAPTALMTNRASSTSSAAVAVPRRSTRQTAACLVPGRAPCTVVPNRQCGRSPYLSTTPAKYVAQLGLLAVVLAPVVGRLERVAVLVAADVDPGARIAVLPPGAARPVVLLDDREREPGLRQPDAGEDPRLRRSRSRDTARPPSDLGRHLGAPDDGAAVAALELQVVEEHSFQRAAAPAGSRGTPSFPAAARGRAGEARSRRRGRPRSPAVPGAAPRRARLRRHAALKVQRDGHPRLEAAPDPRRVAGHVHERTQQRRDADVLQSRGDRRRRRRRAPRHAGYGLTPWRSWTSPVTVNPAIRRAARWPTVGSCRWTRSLKHGVSGMHTAGLTSPRAWPRSRRSCVPSRSCLPGSMRCSSLSS